MSRIRPALSLIVALTWTALVGCGESPGVFGSDTPPVAPGAHIAPPAPLDDSFIRGFEETEPGLYSLNSADPRYDGLRVGYSIEDDVNRFRIAHQDDVYEIHLDPGENSSTIYLNGSKISRSDPAGHETFDGYDQAELSEILRISGTFIQHLESENALEISDTRRRRSVGDIGQLGGCELDLPLASGITLGLGRHVVAYALALQAQQSHWYRASAYGSAESFACYNARTAVNSMCSNSCCIGCAEFGGCDVMCALPGTPYLCMASVSGRSCGEGEGSCGGAGPGGGPAGGGIGSSPPST